MTLTLPLDFEPIDSAKATLTEDDLLARYVAKEVADMDHTVNMHEAKTQLSKLVALAQQGESVTIAIYGKPVVRLIPIKPLQVFGLLKDICSDVPWRSFAPMSDDESAEWGL